ESGGTELTAVTWNGLLDIAATGNLLVTGLVSGSGAAHLAATGDIGFTAAASLVSATAANVALNAGGAINLADGSPIDAGAGTIALLASGNITLGRLVTTNSTASAVSLTSVLGSILDGGDSGGPDITAEGSSAVVTLQAQAGVGTAANALDLAVRNLVV